MKKNFKQFNDTKTCTRKHFKDLVQREFGEKGDKSSVE